MPRRKNIGVPRVVDTAKAPQCLLSAPNPTDEQKYRHRGISVEEARSIIGKYENVVGLAFIDFDQVEVLPQIANEFLFSFGILPSNIDLLISTHLLSVAETLSADIEDTNVKFHYSSCNEKNMLSDNNGQLLYKGIPGKEYMDYTGEIDHDLMNWISARAIASKLLSCGFLGRGVKAGVDWLDLTDKLAASQRAFPHFMEVFTDGSIVLPERLMNTSLSDDQRKFAMGNFARSSYSSRKAEAMKTRNMSVMREKFVFYPISTDAEALKIYEQLEDAERIIDAIVVQHLEDYGIEIPDNPLRSISDINRVNANLEEVGAKAAVQAFFAGVPIDDILA